MNRNDILDRKDEVLAWIAADKSKAFICKQLDCKPITLESYLKKFGVEYRGNQGLRGKVSTKRVLAKDYVKGTCVKSHTLKLKLIREGIKKHECEICGISEWRGKPVPLELDHIDGQHHNNSMKNLRIICPNCHAQQDTNSGKNKRNKRLMRK